MKALKVFPSHSEFWRGCWFYICFVSAGTDYNIHGDDIRMPGNPKKMTVVVCSEKNRCLLKCQPNDLCVTDSEDSRAVFLRLKSNNNGKRSLIAVK